jgi:hypothetical protein
MLNHNSRSAGIGGTRKIVFSWLKNPKPEESILIRAEGYRNFTVTVQPVENAKFEDVLRESDDLANNENQTETETETEIEDEFRLESVQIEIEPIDEESISSPQPKVRNFCEEKSQFSISVARCYFTTNTVIAKYLKGNPKFEGKSGEYFFKTPLLRAKAMMLASMNENLKITVDGRDSKGRAIITEVSVEVAMLSDENRELLSKLVTTFQESVK